LKQVILVGLLLPLALRGATSNLTLSVGAHQCVQSLAVRHRRFNYSSHTHDWRQLLASTVHETAQEVEEGGEEAFASTVVSTGLREAAYTQRTTDAVRPGDVLPDRAWTESFLTLDPDFVVRSTTVDAQQRLAPVVRYAFLVLWRSEMHTTPTAEQQGQFLKWVEDSLDFRGEPILELAESEKSFLRLMESMGVPEGWDRRLDPRGRRYLRVVLGEVSRFHPLKKEIFTATPCEARAFYQTSQMESLRFSEIHAFLTSVGWTGPQLRRAGLGPIYPGGPPPQSMRWLWRYSRRLSEGREAVIMIESPRNHFPTHHFWKMGYPTLEARENQPPVSFDDFGRPTVEKKEYNLFLDKVPQVDLHGPRVTDTSSVSPQSGWAPALRLK
jgi:hypothetical protein